MLNNGVRIYKLIGPLLVQQDLIEIQSEVRKRTRFIYEEIKKLEVKQKDLENSIEERKFIKNYKINISS